MVLLQKQGKGMDPTSDPKSRRETKREGNWGFVCVGRVRGHRSSTGGRYFKPTGGRKTRPLKTMTCKVGEEKRHNVPKEEKQK